MKKLLDNKVVALLKNDWLVTGSILITIASIAALAYVFVTMAPALRQEMQTPDQKAMELTRYLSQSVTVPDPRPNRPPRVVTNLTVNASINQQLEQIATAIATEFELIETAAVQRNQMNRQVIREGLFPRPRNPGIPHEAREDYYAALVNLLQRPTADHPGLNAGMAPTAQMIQQHLDAIREQEVIRILGPTAGGAGQAQLSAQEQDQIRRTLFNARLDMIRSAARRIHVYVDGMNPRLAGFPFSVVSVGTTPQQFELWEAQMQLWILGDVVRAIELANQTQNGGTSVIEAPVKRIFSIEVLPGYVGLHRTGAFGGTGGGTTGGGGGGLGTQAAATTDLGAYAQAPPADWLVPGRSPEVRANLDLAMPNNFIASPTGRMSNPIYDVRHVRMRAIVDFHQLPALFDAISRVNLMTVLHFDVRNIDEYAHLEQGYFYGSGDMVELTMHIETLWLRSWMLPLMPERVQIALGIIDPPDEAATTTTRPRR